MTKQVKSKQRVADHGEVFTAEREVKAMCDLVKTETERIDSRFLCHQRTFGRAVNSTISFCSSLFMSPSSAAYRERAYMSVYVAGWIEGRRRK